MAPNNPRQIPLQRNALPKYSRSSATNTAFGRDEKQPLTSRMFDNTSVDDKKPTTSKMNEHLRGASAPLHPDLFPVLDGFHGHDFSAERRAREHVEDIKSFPSWHTTESSDLPGYTDPRNMPPPSLPENSSVAAGSTVMVPPLLISMDMDMLFSKDVDRIPYICPLPGIDEPIQSTRQLAYCLALLQDFVPEYDLPPDTLKWRHSTLSNPEEKDRLETMPFQIIQMFSKDTIKGAAAVLEVVQLVPVLNNDHVRLLLKIFIETVDQSRILHLHSLEGLTKVIQGASPGSIDSDDLVKILQSLHEKLSTHMQSHQQRYLLLLAVSRVLDAMVDDRIGYVSRVNFLGSLTDLLQEFEFSENLYLAFQAAYATQALLHVSYSSNNSLARSSQLSSRLLKNTLEAIKIREGPIFTTKEGLKFKKVWYPALRTAEALIELGRLSKFKDLVTTAPCRHQLVFQWGICQLLGRFAMDASQWDLEARQEAIGFLGALYNNGIWDRQKEVDQVIFHVLLSVMSSNDTHLEGMSTCVNVFQQGLIFCIPEALSFTLNFYIVDKSLLQEIEKQNPTLHILESQLMNSIWPRDPPENSTSYTTQLNAVQNQNRRQPSLLRIQSAITEYHAPNLNILRVSGELLDMTTYFVNPVIVEAPAHRQKEKQGLKRQAAAFHRRNPGFESAQSADTQSFIPWEQLFDKCRLRDGSEDIPRRILVHGRAGIGKTTLCKKFVHAHQNGKWGDLFDIVLWIPLHQLKGFNGSTLESLFSEKVFIGQSDSEGKAELAEALAACVKKGKVLFILDGLDGIVADTEGVDRLAFRSLLKALLWQQHVIVTTRPAGVDIKLLPQIDLELETVGFSHQNVDNFLVKVLDPEAARTAQEFFQRTPLMQGLVNIPAQLDAICFSLDEIPRDALAVTMTGLYQLMVRRLWCKDALRLEKKTFHGQDLRERHIHNYGAEWIDNLMATEVQLLGYLAFKGMNSNHQIEFNERDLLGASEELKNEEAGSQWTAPYELVDIMKETSFLHTADIDLNSGNGSSRQAWYFLQLTLQEYFAATWIVRHFHHEQQRSTAGMMTEDELKAFVQRNKYNPQFEIVWTMVAGLLEGDQLSDFFNLLQGAPRDLLGGYHQQLLASCLNEARNRLDLAVIAKLDNELKKWLCFEIQACQHDDNNRSMLGSQPAFPETCLLETLGSSPSWKPTLLNTLTARSGLSGPAIHFLIASLKDGDWRIRSSSASALGKQTKMPRSAIQSLIDTVKDGDSRAGSLAAWVLGEQFTLGSAIQSLISALKDNDWKVGSLAAYVLGKQCTLSESDIQSFVAALKNHERAASSVSLALSGLSTFLQSDSHPHIATLKDEDINDLAGSELVEPSESSIQSLLDQLKDKNRQVRSSAVSALGEHSKLPESSIQPLLTALNDDDYWGVRYSVALALQKQSALSETAIRSLIVALKDENKAVRSSAALTLRKQTTFPEFAIQPLIDALKDDDKAVRLSAVLILGKQPTLPKPVIPVFIAALQDEDEDIRRAVSEAFQDQCHSLCMALPHLTKDEITSLYENHLFRYSCGRVLSLQVHDGSLVLYTEQGVLRLDTVGNDLEEVVTSAITTAQRNEGLTLATAPLL